MLAHWDDVDWHRLELGQLGLELLLLGLRQGLCLLAGHRRRVAACC